VAFLTIPLVILLDSTSALVQIADDAVFLSDFRSLFVFLTISRQPHAQLPVARISARSTKGDFDHLI
jgi:hypothetical protein